MTEFRLRPRSWWDILALGILMYRTWLPGILATWGPFMVLSGLGGLLLVGGEGASATTVTAGFLLVWWLKPLGDRCILMVPGHCLFGASFSPKSLPGALRSLLSPRIITDLTVFRFSPSRALLLPVETLERCRGRRGRDRRRRMGKAGGSGAWGIAGLCILLESTIFLGLLFTVAMTGGMVSAGAGGPGPDLEGPVPWFLMYWGAVLLAEPVFVLSSFSLYLDRRSRQEAWDLRTEFRDMARDARRGSRSVVVLPLLLILLFLPAGAAPLQGEETNALPDFATALDTEASRETYGGERTVGHPAFKDSPEPSATPETGDFVPPDPGLLVEAGAQILRGFAVLAALALPVILFLNRHRLPGISRRRRRAGVASVAPVLPVPGPVGPGELITRAGQMWEAGDSREALALLYRACLLLAPSFLGSGLGDEATEGDWREHLRRCPPGNFRHAMERVIGLWMGLAWAHMPLSEGEFKASLQDVAGFLPPGGTR